MYTNDPLAGLEPTRAALLWIVTVRGTADPDLDARFTEIGYNVETLLSPWRIALRHMTEQLLVAEFTDRRTMAMLLRARFAEMMQMLETPYGLNKMAAVAARMPDWVLDMDLPGEFPKVVIPVSEATKRAHEEWLEREAAWLEECKAADEAEKVAAEAKAIAKAEAQAKAQALYEEAQREEARRIVRAAAQSRARDEQLQRANNNTASDDRASDDDGEIVFACKSPGLARIFRPRKR